MARVKYVTTNDAEGDAKEVLTKMEQRGSDILNLHRALANSPNSLRNFIRLGTSLLRFGALPPALREIAILRVGQMAGARYEWAHHVPIARQAGVSEEQVAELDRWPQSPQFDEAERAVLRYVEAVASLDVPDAVFGAVRDHLTEGQVAELTLVAGYWGMVARALVALDVDVEPPFERFLPEQA